MNVSDLLVQKLNQAGIKHAFGIPAHSILDITDAIFRSGSMEFITVRHEQVAASMADGYARVTGIPAVCMAGVGPGAANMVLGVANAYRASIPLLAITANVELQKLGRDSFNEWNQGAVFQNITKQTFQIRDPGLAPNIIDRAIRSTVTNRPGPVHLDVPEGIGYAEVKDPMESTRIVLGPSRMPARIDDVKETLEILKSAETPILIAGGGALWSGASATLREFVELLSIPTVTSMTSRGILPEDHPLCFGPSGSWGFQACNDLVKSADVIISLGFRFGEWPTNGWSLIPQDCRIVHVDLEPSEIGRQYDAAVGIVADVDTFLMQLLSLAKLELKKEQNWPSDRLKNLQEQLISQREAFFSSLGGIPIDPKFIIGKLMRLAKKDAIVTIGAGKHALFAARMLATEPRHLLKAGEFGPMSFAFPAALGAKVARPEKQVICLVGDGDFMMTIQDLETAVRNKLTVISIVFNDGCYNAERLPRHEGRQVGIEFNNPDFVKLADSFGAIGVQVSRPEDLEPALKQMFEEEVPGIIDVVIDKDARI